MGRLCERGFQAVDPGEQRRGRRPSLTAVGGGQGGGEVLGEGRRGGVVEQEARREAQPGGRAEVVAQFHGGQGVEAEVAERLRGADRLGRGVSQDCGDLGPDEAEQDPPTLLVRRPGQLPGE